MAGLAPNCLGVPALCHVHVLRSLPPQFISLLAHSWQFQCILASYMTNLINLRLARRLEAAQPLMYNCQIRAVVSAHLKSNSGDALAVPHKVKRLTHRLHSDAYADRCCFLAAPAALFGVSCMQPAAGNENHV
jgi:hypothetical protein